MIFAVKEGMTGLCVIFKMYLFQFTSAFKKQSCFKLRTEVYRTPNYLPTFNFLNIDIPKYKSMYLPTIYYIYN